MAGLSKAEKGGLGINVVRFKSSFAARSSGYISPSERIVRFTMVTEMWCIRQ